MGQGERVAPSIDQALDRLARDFPGHAADFGAEPGDTFEAVIWETVFPFHVVAASTGHETDGAALAAALDTLATRRAAEALS